MLKSMTGFGRCEKADAERKVVVEMKAVNHRYLDINVKIPKKLSFYEAGIRSILKKYISRGKADVFISFEELKSNNVCVKYNEAIAKEYYDSLKKMAETFDVKDDISVSLLSNYPEVLTLEEEESDEQELWHLIEEAVTGASVQLVESRSQEGENLSRDLCDKLNAMLQVVRTIEGMSPQILNEYRDKLRNKVEELLGDTKIDESILATEVTIFADKICVDEETVRLKSHIENMLSCLKQGEEVGRRLDFIAQEMNREANTILSKANNIDITNMAIDLKTEIEKIREQIQNIE
ncbi:YicC/YloC family endoribonuclease [Anaerocolumna sp. AGMB13020]|uniref:YicC/YloC family endoribonuclease n=1 Tax=Anaerocolumna sp. AGMB13020 TaxID=3081750 RepID=UPI002953B474|nr:YicC/YloC family endoribonuclease [Anaerocolumna sp. AGMB13020]WOO39125.1 YicC/YloC family endoribonuclease [Anaerocolumna sp. AGMB13020]